jgi:protein-disulfide isomerase
MIIFIRLAAFILVFSFTAGAMAQVPWTKIPNISQISLTPELQAKTQTLMKKENCYDECPESVFDCTIKPQPSQTSLRMTGIIVRMLAANATDQEISDELAARARSAQPFRASIIKVDKEPPYGKANAKVKVVVFADFDCPYCQVVSPRLKKLAHTMGDDVVYYFKIFPVKAHGPSAIVTSMAGRAAALQSKFWEFHDLMYQHFEDHDPDDMTGYVTALGMDPARFNTDADSDQVNTFVRATKREGVKLGVKSTPSIFVNGKRYYGKKEAIELKDRLQEELEILAREGQ